MSGCRCIGACKSFTLLCIKQPYAFVFSERVATATVQLQQQRQRQQSFIANHVWNIENENEIHSLHLNLKANSLVLLLLENVSLCGHKICLFRERERKQLVECYLLSCHNHGLNLSLIAYGISFLANDVDLEFVCVIRLELRSNFLNLTKKIHNAPTPF